MKKLNNEEMINVKGGAISWKIASVVGAGLVFVIGLIDGLVNPKKCN